MTDRNTKSRAILLVLPLILALTACGAGDRATTGTWAGSVDTLESGLIHSRSPATGLWDETTAWTVEEELRIGTIEGTGPYLFGDLSALAVDDYGRIYALDRQANEVRVFDIDGEHIRTIGRTGSGPGEFRMPIGLLWGAEDRLWVVDPGNARYAIFDTTGTYQAMVRRTSNFMRLPWPGGFDSDGHLFDTAILTGESSNNAPGIQALIAFEVGSQDPVPADTIRIPEFDAPTFDMQNEDGVPLMSVGIPFAPRLIWHFEPRGALWTTVTDSYRISRLDHSGDTTRIIERDFRRLPVTSEDRELAIEGLDLFAEQGGRVDHSRIPSTKPAINSLFTDPDGYLWVQPVTTPEDQGHLVDLFDPDGRYLGEIRLPFKLGYYPPLIIGDQLYTITQDELEVQYVVRARLVGRGARASDR